MNTAVITLATRDETTLTLLLGLMQALAAGRRRCTLIWVVEEASRHLPLPEMPPDVDVRRFDPPRPASRCDSDLPLLNMTRALAGTLRDFEIVYGFISGHPAMQVVRDGRLGGHRSPYVVTILDRPVGTFDVSMDSAEQTAARSFGELYLLAHSDRVVRLDSISTGDLTNAGVTVSNSWQAIDVHFSCGPRLITSTETAARLFFERRIRRSRDEAQRALPSLSVYVSFTDNWSCDGKVLQLLAEQTDKGFSVVAVNHSSSVEANLAFERLAECYRPHGWMFMHNPNATPAVALDQAVQRSTNEYLIFLDSCDAPYPRLVERLRSAAWWTEDDLIAAWTTYQNEAKKDEGGAETPCETMQASYGIDLVAAMAGASPEPVFIVRRTALDAVGGYPRGLMSGGGRQALAVSVALAGYRTDVISEVLNTRHQTGEKDLRNTIWQGENVRLAFDARLNKINMQSFAMASESVTQQLFDAERKVEESRVKLAQRFRRANGDRMRLLMVISTWPFPAVTGCLLRWWAMIRFLGQRHDLTLLTFCSGNDVRYQQELLRYCRSVFAVGYGGKRLPGGEGLPYLVRERMNESMQEAARAIPSQHYHVALIEQIFLAPFRNEIAAPAVLGEHNIESRLLAQAAEIDIRSTLTPGFANPQRESELMRNFEDRTWPQFSVRTAVNKFERDEIQRRAVSGQTILVENGTDPDLWIENAHSYTGRVVFFGMLGYYPNLDGVLYFWQEIWPDVIRRCPSLELVVAGSFPTSELRTLASRPGFTLIETPPDMRAVAATASVSIVPLRLGSGTRLKILDSMAMGLPVVSTSLGCEGLAVENGEHLLIRDDPQSFADAVVQLVSDPALWQRLRDNGKALVRQQYSWERVLPPLETALQSAAR